MNSALTPPGPAIRFGICIGRGLLMGVPFFIELGTVDIDDVRIIGATV